MDCLYAMRAVFNRSVRSRLGFMIAIAVMAMPSSPAHAVLTAEDLTPTPAEDAVGEKDCPEAWPVSCDASGEGDTGCNGGWEILSDLGQAEILPGDGGASCSTGVRLGLGGTEAEGEPVGAMFPGDVIFAQSGRARDGRDYGGVIVMRLKLTDGSPQCFVRYMFLDRRDLAKVGEEVKAGQRIGSIASSDMNATKDWWEREWQGMEAQVKIDIGCDEALVNLPHFMPREPFSGTGPEDYNSCPLTKTRFPSPPLKYLTSFKSVRNLNCSVGARKDARSGLLPAVMQDNTELETPVGGQYADDVNPRGFIKRKQTSVFSTFKEEPSREALWSANRKRGSGSQLFRDDLSYQQSTAFRCENMRELFSGRDGESITPENVRELLTHCANQYILGRSMFFQVYEKSDSSSDISKRPLPDHLREFLSAEALAAYDQWVAGGKLNLAEGMTIINKVLWRDLCQPLAMQPIVHKDYDVHDLLTKSWRELLVEWPEENNLTPIPRAPIMPIETNSYTEYPYERINDPSHPFSPRHIFAETDRERYKDYGVQCAATPVDLILGDYGDGEKTPFTRYGKRDSEFHQCISCRIELNETKQACFADPYSFQTPGGCQHMMGGTGAGICPNLDPSISDTLKTLSQKYGIIPEFLEYILKRESSCATNAGTTGSCHYQIGGGGGRGIWQIDINAHKAKEVVRDKIIRLLAQGYALQAGTVDNNICDPLEGGEHAVSYVAMIAKKFNCHPGFTAGGYNHGPFGAEKFYPNNLAGLNANTTNNYAQEAMDLMPTDNICLPGGPKPDGSGTAGPLPGGSNGGGMGGLPDIFNPGTGGSAPTSGKPTGIEMVKSALFFRGEPYLMGPGRDQVDSGVADCSGLMAKAYEHLTGIPLLRITKPFWNTSTEIEKWARSKGGKNLTREEAMHTPGAFVTIGGFSKGYIGNGPVGHIGISAGDGKTVVETKSAEGAQVGCSPFNRNNWTDYFQFPDNVIDYTPANNQPIPGLCSMILGGPIGICRFALEASTHGKEDLKAPTYLKEYTVKPTVTPEPPSEKHHTKFDHEVPGMVYEGAWTACEDGRLNDAAKELCEKLNKTDEEDEEGEEQPPSGGSGAFINPLPCHAYGSPYGPRRMFGRTFHYGQDIPAPEGTPVFAVADGEVEVAGPYGNAGNHVTIRHANGTSTGYSHHSKICGNIKRGTKVVQGQVIGYVGTTGDSTGNHLHFWFKNPNYTNPVPHLPAPTPNSPQCPKIKAAKCETEPMELPSGPGIVGTSGPTLCVEHPCSLRYDEADLVSQCAWAKDDGGCGSLGNYFQRHETNGDCCYNITAPVMPLNVLKMRPAYDNEALITGAVRVDEWQTGGWKGMRVNDGLAENGLKGEGGENPPTPENQGAPEGYTFYEHFRNHMPYMRWWDTGAESGNLLQEHADVENTGGSFDALVGVGVEKNSCGIGGWGTPEKLDGNTSWMELKMYQARLQYKVGLRCISRYEKLYKRNAAEDYVLSLAGGNVHNAITNSDILWSVGWRGYASEPIQAYRFPYFVSLFRTPEYTDAQGALIGGGLDQAMQGDILIWDQDVVGQSRLPHVAYVTKAEKTSEGTPVMQNVPLSRKYWHAKDARGVPMSSISVTDYNFGKYPDACGTTNWWGTGQERTLYKGDNLPEGLNEEAESKDVTITDCSNPDLLSCTENFWDNVKIYRPWNDVRD